MGFSALDGLVMATRPGEMDPGALLHLIEAHGHDAKSLTRLLYKESGLLGLSGESEDMRVLLASARPEAKLAIALYVERAARTVASLAVTLGGLDMIAFTGGVGENSAPIRAAILDQLAFLGVEVDPAKNEMNAARFEAVGAQIALAVVPAEEERVIAAATVALNTFCENL
jgi:acetate kinase